MLSANQIEEIKEQAFLCVPSNFLNIGKVYPYTVKDIVVMGTQTYYRYLGLMLLSEVEISEIIKEKTGEEVPIEQINSLEYLLQSAEINDMFLLEVQNAFTTFLKEETLLLPAIDSVLIGKPEEKRLITKENFGIFQDILRIQHQKEIKAAPPVNETPGERKMRLLREKVEEVKRKKAQTNGISFVELMEIAETFGIDVNNCSLYAMYRLIQRHQLKEKWDSDLRAICAGADPKKMKTKYWGETTSKE